MTELSWKSNKDAVVGAAAAWRVFWTLW